MQTPAKKEYEKLDIIDRKILHWTIKKDPASVPSWIEYTAKFYRTMKGIQIDSQRLLNEVRNGETES